MKIKFELDEWQVMVLRAALANHMKDAPAKHVQACREIEKQSRAKDNPFGALKRVASR